MRIARPGWVDTVEKVFWGDNKRNFLELLTRSVHGDVRDHIAFRKTTMDLRIGTTDHRSGGVVQCRAHSRHQELNELPVQCSTEFEFIVTSNTVKLPRPARALDHTNEVSITRKVAAPHRCSRKAHV
jgi:hypothetical protein